MSRTKEIQRLSDALEQLTRIGQSRRGDAIRAARAGVQLPRSAQNLLRQVLRDGPSRISDLARATGTGDAAASRQVSLLVTEGLLTRGTNPDDGREAIVQPTARGRRTAARLREAVDEIFDEQLAGWRRDRLATAAELLEALVRDLRRPPRT